MITAHGVRRCAGSIVLAAALAGCSAAGGTRSAAPSTAGSPVRTSSPPATRQTLNLPNVHTAELAACEADFQTLRSAENTYQMVNEGHYASMHELLDGQYIAGPVTYYVAVKIGTPVGGFTLIAAPDGPCASLPVRDPH